MHADHCGLVPKLAADTSRVYFSQIDATFLEAADSRFWERQANFARINGFPEDELQQAINNHPGYKYRSRDYRDFYILAEGNTINIGDYLFTCIETPGHTKGHMCLYEPNKKLFISGDHILINITPNISLWSDENNPLSEYLLSLDKVYDLDVALVLPGHRSPFKHFRERIQELKDHHQKRTSEVLAILEAGKQNAGQVARQMNWDMSYESWEQFPSSQKWFASGEAIAHLKYLVEKGKVRREIQGQKVVFSLK
jgi:glyoxylase-like metal-dependent hydrolase (beta-lactamase superfamily II)